MPATLLFWDERMVEHDPGAGHPERPERLEAIRGALVREPIAGTAFHTPTAASREAVERVHSGALVDRVDALRGTFGGLDPDTSTSPASVEAAYLAVGAGIAAVEAVVAEPGTRALSLVRPPGHHAERDRGMGFCFFNNIAIAAEHARAHLGISRILIVDWDVHHGNGTQQAFYRRDDVLFFDVHQSPLYPGSGALEDHGLGPGEGFTVNVPLPPGMGDPEYARVFRELLVPVAESFQPELVLVSAGFDAHARDPLGQMDVTQAGFAELMHIVVGLADRLARGRLAVTLEGGYDLQALVRSVYACTQVMAGVTETADPGAPAESERGMEQLRRVLAHQRRFWPV